jgi:hypothetical protein
MMVGRCRLSRIRANSHWVRPLAYREILMRWRKMQHGRVRRVPAVEGQKGKSERNAQMKGHPLPILGMGCARPLLHVQA